MDLEEGEKQRRIAALKIGSLGSLALITPGLCLDYLRAFAADRERWQHHLKQFPVRQTRRQALGWLSADGKPPLVAYFREEKPSSCGRARLDSGLHGAHTGSGERHGQLSGDRRHG
jgi:hypothetical protein